MPIPEAPQQFQLGADSCSTNQVSVTTANIVDLIKNLSDAEVATVQDSILRWVNDVTPVTFLQTIFSKMNADDIGLMSETLGIPSTTRPDYLEDVYEFQSPAQKQALIASVFQDIGTIDSGDVTIQSKTGVTGSVRMKFTWPPPKVEIDTEIDFNSTGGGGMMKTIQALLEYCGDTTGGEAADIAVVVDPVTNADDAPFKLFVLNALSSLLKCCNPCAEDNHLNSIVSIAGVYVSGTFPGITRIVFTVVQNPVPKVITFGDPPLTMLAKFRWVYKDGKKGPVQYLNEDQAEIFGDPQKCAGFEANCYAGVELSAIVYTSPVWGGLQNNLNPTYKTTGSIGGP